MGEAILKRSPRGGRQYGTKSRDHKVAGFLFMSDSHITDAQVEHIAELARLNLSVDDVEKYKGQFNDILEYVGKLQEVDTANVQPTSQVTGLTNVYREDVVEESLPQSVVTALAPESQDGFVVVHAVFSDNG